MKQIKFVTIGIAKVFYFDLMMKEVTEIMNFDQMKIEVLETFYFDQMVTGHRNILL